MPIFDPKIRTEQVLDVIRAQQQLESIGAMRMRASPSQAPEEHAALERLYTGCLNERDLCYDACDAAERVLFDQWRRSAVALRELLVRRLNAEPAPCFDCPIEFSPLWAARHAQR